MSDSAFSHDPVALELRRRAEALPPRSVPSGLARDILTRRIEGNSSRTRLLLLAAALVLGLLVAATVPGRNPRFTVTQPSGAMEPTVLIGERVVFDRELEPERGDVVVGRISNGGEPFDTITRVMAVGGDTIACPPAGSGCDAVVVNGEVVEEPYLGEMDFEPFEQTVVEDGHVFVLGDNRGNAIDSRAVGTVSRTDISGVAVQILDAGGEARGVPGAPDRPGSDDGIADPPEPVPPASSVEQ